MTRRDITQCDALGDAVLYWASSDVRRHHLYKNKHL
jgi:hypothetical protein